MRFTEKELEKIKKERMEQIDKLLDNEYGMSYTRLEELHNCFFEKYTDQKEEIERLNKENEVLRHRLEVANEYIDSRKEIMIIDNYDDLKYIINECDLESTW